MFIFSKPILKMSDYYIENKPLKKPEMISLIFKGLLFLTLLMSMLTACTTVQTISSDEATWQIRRSKLQNWQIKGTFSIKTPDQAFSASLFWQQNFKNYFLRLFGPLGIGTIYINGQPNHVVLQTNKKQSLSAQNPEQLLQQQLGWHLPISSLYYWIRGLPTPNMIAIKQFDQYHRLTYLKQQGWEIHYLEYVNAKGICLPSKIFLDHKIMHIRLFIKEWIPEDKRQITENRI
jgi:outer membrane lipoprotein LolB